MKPGAFGQDPSCHVCANCGVSRPRSVLSLGDDGRILCVRTDHCLALLATTPKFSTQHEPRGTNVQ